MERIVFSNVDGTLLNTDHKITALTLQAVRDLKKRDPFCHSIRQEPFGH